MTATDFGPTAPLALAEVRQLFDGAPFRWWVTGGYALELHFGASWRGHGDIDVGVRRDDTAALYEWFAGWDVHVAAAGRLTPWSGEPLQAAKHQNNLWCRRQPGGPWCLDIVLGAGTDDRWIYRRDERITRPWDDTVLPSADGTPYLAPELQLLFKSKDVRPKDDLDARTVIPQLDATRRAALADLLPAGHPWQQVIEEPLPGGAVTDVVRLGDTVRRRQAERAPFVHELLRYFEQHGWPGAPRFLGGDEQGREILSFIPGHVAWAPDQPAAVGADASLVRVAQLVREFHDLTAGTALAGNDEVVCHNDLAPRNTVYDGDPLRPVAFVDWDLAAPGRRIHDLAHVCWQYVHLGPAITDVADAARRVRLVADSYGLADTDRPRLVDTILWWQDRCWRGIDKKADNGDPAMIRLRGAGTVADVRANHAWTTAHRRQLDAAIRKH